MFPWRRRARRFPLRGADLVFVAMHRQYAGSAISQNTMLVAECHRTVEPERVRRALERLAATCPWLTARLRRPFPWGALHWVTGRPGDLDDLRVRELAVGSPAALHQRLEGELNAALDPDREAPLRLSSIEGPPHGQGRGSLVLTWCHPLMDPRGGQAILRHLAELDPVLDGRSCRRTPPTLPVARERRSLRERARLGRQTLHDMRTLTRVPAVSPGTGLTSFGRARFWHGAFVSDIGGAGDTRATRDVCWRLAVVGKAMTALWQKRGLPELPFLVPISVDLRPKGSDGAAVGNWLAFHFARFEPADTANVARAARHLRVQMADAVREGRIDANAVGMEFLRYRPLGIMRRSLPGGGDAFSFNFADLGDTVPGLSTAFGQRIVNAYHVPAVLPRPGVGVFFSRFADRNNLVISWVEGAMTDDEVSHLGELVREEMGWAEAP